jgi:hypothetical protein
MEGFLEGIQYLVESKDVSRKMCGEWAEQALTLGILFSVFCFLFSVFSLGLP